MILFTIAFCKMKTALLFFTGYLNNIIHAHYINNLKLDTMKKKNTKNFLSYNHPEKNKINEEYDL